MVVERKRVSAGLGSPRRPIRSSASRPATPQRDDGRVAHNHLDAWALQHLLVPVAKSALSALYGAADAAYVDRPLLAPIHSHLVYFRRQ